MTSFSIRKGDFTSEEVSRLERDDPRLQNWPVVYLLDDSRRIYVGESLTLTKRFRQHAGTGRREMSQYRIILDDRFNKSACLDLESYLIRLLAGDGNFEVTNANAGVTDSNYFNRDDYQAIFEDIFANLAQEGLFTKPIREIENSDLYKLSPFKSLNTQQSVAVLDIMRALFEDLESDTQLPIVIQGDPGTGKTIVGIYLMKLLADIKRGVDVDTIGSESIFTEFFDSEYRNQVEDLRIGFVIPQQSLRKSVSQVFKLTASLHTEMVLSPFQVGEASPRVSEDGSQRRPFDLVIVDETHRLNRRANQPSGMQNKKFKEINRNLFGDDDVNYTQLDWIRAQSYHQIFLLDGAQAVRPADIGDETVTKLILDAQQLSRNYTLESQMRVQGGSDYIRYVRSLFSPVPEAPHAFENYEFRMFENLGEMVAQVKKRDSEVGLSRLLAGFAWEWKTKNDREAFDIEVEDQKLRWNGTAVDWVNSPNSLNEVGSIHTIQGYDLNYAGVIIGPDIYFDEVAGRIRLNRASYFDKKGRQNNPALGQVFDDDGILRYVINIYSVLMTRGMKGTYVYVCDPALRRRLRNYIPVAGQTSVLQGSQPLSTDSLF